jgi:hypothetical protein
MKCLQKKVDNNIVYINDDPLEKSEVIQRFMKTCERIVFIDFGIGIDEESIEQFFEPHEGVGCVVFPGVSEGVDWGMFKEKLKNGSSEPVSQMGLHFDTEIGKKVSPNIYHATSTSAKVWVMNTKNVIKSIKDKKTGNWKVSSNMFDKFREHGVRIYAFTAAKLTMTYTHECVSNILNAAGVKVN